jgi:Ca-activated chloride channel family protein
MLYDYISNMEFAHPIAFGLFILVPVMIFLYWRKNNSKQAAITVSTTQSYQILTWKNRFRHFPFVLRLLTISALILAIARPQKRNQEERTEGEGIDIVLCMDVSGSMGSRDILPSRMEVAKEVAEEFVRSRPVDRIGLVIFSGESFTQCPITTDRNTLLAQIKVLESRRFLADGTVIGEGLATAVDRLSQAKGKSRVIILLTDGKEDPPETRLIDPITAIDIAKSRGVKVYTIGMSAAASTIVENTPANRARRTPAIDFLDEGLLKRIANETGGQYFRARDKRGLQFIYKQIDQLEKVKVEVQVSQRFEDRYLPFLLAALFFLFMEYVLKFTILRKFP